ncbi:MAG TPA: cytochrome c [Aromatoleum sp.]|uniref:c-type cytochrome n=1 Tax=Aromatoleum sp. TaxID=2307007 RepID=UPI002B4A3141|nr:cytochrome c [Aromatoleum sp.]HJV26909.1 cytochrome c [Aromatoleum sp.]
MRSLPALLAGACLTVVGCEKSMQDMYDQPRHKPFAESSLFADGSSARTTPEGTAPHADGPFAGTSSGRLGTEDVERDRAATAAAGIPYAVTRAVLERGRERFTIYCQPCHSPVGDGDGLIVRRGFPAPPSFHIERLRSAPDRHFFEVITRGYGVMYPYADRVRPEDRWAIVAYIRALQLSQGAKAAELPDEVRRELAQAAGEGR